MLKVTSPAAGSVGLIGVIEGNLNIAHRGLSWYMDGDEMWVFKGKFTAE